MTASEIPVVAGEPDYLHALLNLCGGDISTLLAVIREWRKQASLADKWLTKDEIAARLIGDTALLKRLLEQARRQA